MDTNFKGIEFINKTSGLGPFEYEKFFPESRENPYNLTDIPERVTDFTPHNGGIMPVELSIEEIDLTNIDQDVELA